MTTSSSTWALRGAYRLDWTTIVDVLDKVLSTALSALEYRDVLRQALDDCRGGGGDFANHLIGRRNRRAGCESTATFDRALEDSSGFTLL